MGEQNETGSEGELSPDVRPTIQRRCGRLRHDPELRVRVVDERHGLAGGGGDGPALTEEVDLLIGVDAAPQVQGQMQVQQTGGGARAPGRAAFAQGQGAGRVGRLLGGAAAGAVWAGQFAVEQLLGGGVGGDARVGQERDQTVLKGAEAAFDFAFGLRAGGDEVGDAQGGEGALELGAWLVAARGGHMAEQGQAVGVEGQGQAVGGEEAAEVLEVMPGGVRGDEGGPEQRAGMVVDGEQEGLLVCGRPPLVDRGVMLPEFADPGALPAAARLGPGRGGGEQQRELSAGIGRDGFAVAQEGEAGGQFVGDKLEVGRALERQEGEEELADLAGPSRAVVAAGSAGGEVRGLVQAGGPQAKEVGATDVQQFGGGKGVQVAALEGVKGLVEKLRGEAAGELAFFKQSSNRARARRASPFVSLRFAPASSRTGPAGGVSFCSPSQSHFVPAPTVEAKSLAATY